MKCASVQLSLGAYVLGALGRRESRQITAHVVDCDPCRTELRELARLRPLLERLSLDELDAELDLAGDAQAAPAVQPPSRVLRRLLRQTATQPERAAQHSRPRWGLVAAAFMLAAVVAGGVATVVAVWPSPSANVAVQAQPSTFSVTDTATNVVVDAKLTARPSGTDITISLTGGTPGEWCWLVALGQDGRMQQFASWEVTGAGKAMVTDHTEIPRADLSRLRVVRDDQTLLADVAVG